MKKVYIIIAANSDCELFTEVFYGTEEGARQHVLKVIKEDAAKDGWECGTESISGFHGECWDGFSGYNSYAYGCGAVYHAYPVDNIRMFGLMDDAEECIEEQQVVNKGYIHSEAFSLTGFDESDIFWQRNLPAGMYEYRILDVRGRRLQQILVGGEWIDIAGNNALMGAIREQIEESGAVA